MHSQQVYQSLADETFQVKFIFLSMHLSTDYKQQVLITFCVEDAL